jgi:hypothetical protein
MASKSFINYFNEQPRMGALSTSNKQGSLDSAIIASRMIDEETLVVGLGNNRTYSYLRENPRAVYTVVQTGDNTGEWKGVRVYLIVKESVTSGEMLERIRHEYAEAAGEQVAQMIHAAVSFQIEEIRPLVDHGQGWEQSV